jgi:hypothetical protein
MFLAMPVSAQDKGRINFYFEPTFHGKKLDFNGAYYRISDKDSISFETFKCYISAVVFYKYDSLYKNEKPEFKEKNSYHLIESGEGGSMEFSVEVPLGLEYSSVSFNIGIDSITNVSGILSGDLDPAKGMYWAWQSGYINFKLEGKSNLCFTRKNVFSFHLGGYLPPNLAMQTIKFSTGSAHKIIVEFPLDQFIESIDLSKQNSVMIPGKDAVELLKLFARQAKMRTAIR